MRAIIIVRPILDGSLELREVATPMPGKGEVRIAVRATAVNRADLLQARGQYPAPSDAPADIPGLEYAGVIDALGDGVTSFATGDRVFGLAGGGTYAEFVVVHAHTVTRMPARLSFNDAAALPEAFITAYDAMVTQAALAAGETVLVHAVGSGVGTAAVQIARAIGARCIGAARTVEKLKRIDCPCVVSAGGQFSEQVMKLTFDRGVDVVLDLVGGHYVAEDLKALAPRGRLVLVGLLAGAKAEIDLGLVLRKRLHIMGTVLRSRPLDEKIAAAVTFERHVVPLIDSGILTPVVDRVVPFENARSAHAYVATNESFGKVVLEVSRDA